MRLRQVGATPAVAAIALSGAVAFGGCGGDSNAATDGSTTDSMHHAAMRPQEGEAMKHDEGAAMKHEGAAMKHQGNAMHHEGSSSDYMEG